MPSGSLQIKRNIYYAVLNFTDETGKRRQKWISTQLSALGHNKRAAVKFLNDTVDEYERKKLQPFKDPLFAEYAEEWLENARYLYDPITFQGYESAARGHIIPYFKRRKMTMQGITPSEVQRFSTELLKKGNLKTGGGLSGKSVRNYLTVLSQIFEDAVQKEIVADNPVRKVKKPQKQRYSASFYTVEQLKSLFEALDDDPLKPMIVVTSIYGLRRSELLGLKWDSLDFSNKRVTIKHTVSKFSTVVEKDRTKTDSSYRTYPMPPAVETIFREAKEKEQQNKKLFGSAYQENEYVFKWDDGRPYRPDYITRRYQNLLEKNNLPVIRFHDLRHSCASILIASGCNLKDVQEWLGHADIQTTGNIYGHLTNEHLEAVGNTICESLFDPTFKTFSRTPLEIPLESLVQHF